MSRSLPFELAKAPSHWTVAALGFYFSERKTLVSDTEFAPLSVTKDGVVPQLETAAKTDNNDTRKLVRVGDFVINSRSDRKGSAGLSSLDGSVSPISTVLVPRSMIHPPYANYLLRSVPFQEEFYRWGSGIVADLWSTRFSAMRRIPLPVPPIEEQQAIADFLDRETAQMDALIGAQQGLVARLEERRLAVVDAELGRRGFRPSGDLEAARGATVPQEWAVVKLSQVLRQLTNGYVGPTRDILVDEGVRYVQGMHIKSGRIDFDRRHFFVTREWHDARPRIHLREGDVLIVQTGDIGRVAVVPPNFGEASCHALQIARVRPDMLSGEYLAAYLSSWFGYNTLLYRASGALHPHLEGGIRAVPVVVPPLEVQDQILRDVSSRTSRIDEMIIAANDAIALMQERRSALISAAVTGRIDPRAVRENTPERVLEPA